MDIKKAFVKVFNSKTTVFDRLDGKGSSKAIGGLANNNKKFIDLVAQALKYLEIDSIPTGTATGLDISGTSITGDIAIETLSFDASDVPATLGTPSY